MNPWVLLVAAGAFLLGVGLLGAALYYLMLWQNAKASESDPKASLEELIRQWCERGFDKHLASQFAGEELMEQRKTEQALQSQLVESPLMQRLYFAGAIFFVALGVLLMWLK